jgi:sirohydrochlorin ferrochelatase
MAKVIGPDPKMARLALLRALSVKGDPTSTSLLLVGRGAREKRAWQDLREIASWIRKSGKFKDVHPCFYAMAEPTLEKTLKKGVLSGSKSIRLMPYLFFSGDLVSKIRLKAKEFSGKNEKVAVQVAPPLGAHKFLFQVMDERLRRMAGKRT